MAHRVASDATTINPADRAACVQLSITALDALKRLLVPLVPEGSYWRDALAVVEGFSFTLLQGDVIRMRAMATEARHAIRARYKQKKIPPIASPSLPPREQTRALAAFINERQEWPADEKVRFAILCLTRIWPDKFRDPDAALRCIYPTSLEISLVAAWVKDGMSATKAKAKVRAFVKKSLAGRLVRFPPRMDGNAAVKMAARALGASSSWTHHLLDK